MWQKYVDGSSYVYIRCKGTVSGLSYDKVLNYFSDLRDRGLGDDTITKCELIEEDTTKNTAMFRYIINSPAFFISDRESVARRTVREGFPDEKSTSVYITSE